MEPARFCNLVWYWITRGMDDERLATFVRDLEKPPTGTAAEQIASTGAWSRDAELAQFRKASG